ncbi:Hpt domain-containing protein [Cephalotus follicularis]|uniref:Histidine-containing phosphotransfer protein n=1 Tax=Cephalotus follicularis TaxID=3775 RepID=A0A1Q3DKL0_CEPFO|nr:Hpt domain-containing protein [Cephalotus follicularis]
MAGVAQLQRQLVEYRHSLFDEGILGDYFKQLEQLQDESGPDFVIQVATSFNNDSENHLHKLTEALEQESVDFEKVVYHVLKLKGSSSCMGAHKVSEICTTFHNFCKEKNIEKCKKCLEQVKDERSLLKGKLETLFEASK